MDSILPRHETMDADGRANLAVLSAIAGRHELVQHYLSQAAELYIQAGRHEQADRCKRTQHPYTGEEF